MKKSLIILSLAAALLIPFSAVVSCTEDNNLAASSSSVIVIEDSVLTVLAGGGSQSVSYSIESPAKGLEIQPICPEIWVNGFNVDAENILSFNVDRNEGGYREAVITVMYGKAESKTIKVRQYSAQAVLLSELEGKSFTATYCHWDRTQTIMYNCNPENPGEISVVDPITAGEFAENYARDFNMANPDSMATMEDFLLWLFQVDTVANVGTYFDVDFAAGNNITVHYGNVAPAGSVDVIQFTGEFTYDEATGIMNVLDIGNTTFPDGKEVTLQFSRDGNDILYECLNTGWPETSVNYYYFQSYDSFGFTIYDYNEEKVYRPWKKLVYRLKEHDLRVVE